MQCLLCILIRLVGRLNNWDYSSTEYNSVCLYSIAITFLHFKLITVSIGFVLVPALLGSSGRSDSVLSSPFNTCCDVLIRLPLICFDLYVLLSTGALISPLLVLLSTG